MPSIQAMEGNGCGWRRHRLLGSLALVASLGCLTVTGNAQETGASSSVAEVLPQEPAPQTPNVSKASVAQDAGSVEGVITDTDGDFVPGARVALMVGGAGGRRQTVTDGQGRFSFAGVKAGDFTLSVAADGLAARVVPGTLAVGEQKVLDPIALTAGTSVDVNVTVSQQDLAEEELKVEEKQRIGGFIPNFFVTYDWKAAPLTAKQKWELAWRTSLDPSSFILNGAFAGVEQATNSFPGYGQGAAGYGKRFGAATADYTVGTMVGGYLLPVVFRQDPRYFYMGTGTIRHRTLYALAAAFICRGDNGKWQPNYSSVLGNLAAGAISNVYYPASDRNGATLTIENGLLSSGEDAIGNVVQEFLIRKLTPGTHRQQP